MPTVHFVDAVCPYCGHPIVSSHSGQMAWFTGDWKNLFCDVCGKLCWAEATAAEAKGQGQSL